MYGRGDYRIRNSRRTQDDLDFDTEQHLKVSTHIHSQKKQSQQGFLRKFRQSSQNSRLKESRTNSGFGSIVNSRCARVIRKSRNQKDKNTVTDIEFNNVRWISIVSAYDSKRLRHVTVSKQSCQTFLKKYGNGLKKDPAAMAYFKDIKKHFHSWLAKINETFIMVLNHFLSNSQKSPLSELQKVNPILEEIRADTAMMKEKLDGCLKYYENNDFRKMADRFKQFFSFSSRLEELICIIFEKKQKIDMLFYELQRGGNVDRSLQKIRKEGIKQTKKLIYADKQHYNDDLCQKIMDKVGKAINQMASKGLNIFHKLQGAKSLIHRIKKILTDANRRLTIKEIRTFSEIFQQVLEQTSKFQLFVQEFDSENDFVTTQLKEKIHQCRQDLIDKKKTVGDMQVIFVGTVISQTIDLLSHSFSLNKAVNFPKNQYHEYNHLLDAIAGSMLNQTKKTITQGLIKQNKIAFTRLEEDVDKIRGTFKRNDEGFIIDTQDGQVASMECNKLTKHYKEKIKSLIKKHEDALKSLEAKFTPTRLPSQDKDNELLFLAELVSLTTLINNQERHQKMLGQKAFHDVKDGIATSASELDSTTQILGQLEDSRKKIQQLNEKNPLKQLIVEIGTENGLYLECQYLLNMMKLTSRVSENNLIESIGKINDEGKKRKKQLENNSSYKQTKAYKHVIDRLYCQVLVKGLKKNTLRELDDSKYLNFPESDSDQKHMENEVKYRTLICGALCQEARLAKIKLSRAISIMKDLISARSTIQKLKFNENGQYVALTNVISAFTTQMFKSCLIKPKNQGLSTETRKIVLEIAKCLKSKSMNIDILEGELDIENNEALLRARKQFISVKNINQTALNICEELSKIQDNDPLQILSKITHAMAEYLHANKQSVYLALNEWRQPVWIGQVEQAKDGICSQIQLRGYPRGTFTDSYTHQAPKAYGGNKQKVVKAQNLKKQQEKQKGSKRSSGMLVRQKSHPVQSMDEQIPVEESDRQMAEDIEDFAEQDMGEEIGQMEQNYEDDMEEQEMGEQIGDMDEQIISEPRQEDMVEDIGEEGVEIVKPSMNKVEYPKKQEQAKQQPKPVKKYQKPVYEIIPFFRQLEQIKEMFDKIYLTDKIFWKQNVDFQEIEDYYHREEDLKDRGNFIKSLQNCFSMYLGSRFGAKLGEAVKNLDKLKSIKGSFMSLGEKNWDTLFKLLTLIERNYSYMQTSKGQVLQAFIFDGDSGQFRRQTWKKCVYDYLERTFKTTEFKTETFDYEGYIRNCLLSEVEQLINEDGVSFHYVIKNTARNSEALPEKDSDLKVGQLKQISSIFEDNRQTGLSVSLTCLKFWIKAVGNEESFYKPDYSVLDSYIKKLAVIEKKDSIYHYLTPLADNMGILKSHIKKHKNGFDNLLFKVDNTNILDCIKQLASLYPNAKLLKLSLAKQDKFSLLFLARQNEQQASKEVPMNQLVSSLSTLFSNLQSSEHQSHISTEKLIRQIQSQCKKGSSKSQNFSHFMEILNILQIEHYFISQPQFLLKSNLQELVLNILSPIGIQKATDFNYEELMNNIFTTHTKSFSNELSLKSTINPKVLSVDYIRQTEKKVDQIEKEVQKHSQCLKDKIKNSDMSSLLADQLQNKANDNQLLQTIIEYQSQLKKCSKDANNSLNKEHNILMYVHSHKAKIQKLTAEIEQKVIQAKPLTIKSSMNNNMDNQLASLDQFFTELKNWGQKAGVSKQCTTYILNTDEKNYIINMEFSQGQNERQKSKQYLEKMLARHWISDNTWKNTWDHLYEKYIDKQVKIEIGAGGVSCIHYNLKAAVKKIMEDVRLDLADKKDVVEYTHHYNVYKFTHSSQSLQSMNRNHAQIDQRLTLKKQLLEIQKIVRNNTFSGLAGNPLVSTLLSCIKDELDIKQNQLQKIMSHHESIRGKEPTLSTVQAWYKQLGHQKLGCHYIELYTQGQTMITILPMLKLQKDKTKNNQQIEKQLRQIKLESSFHLKLVGGIQRAYLDVSSVECVMRDEQKYLNSNDQLSGFQPQIVEGQMLLLIIQQLGGKESVPLLASQLTVSANVELILSEENTTCQLSCGVWRIGKNDLQNIKRQQYNSKHQQNKAIHKKVRGLASPEEKSKEISIGQTVFFDAVGHWLAGELKKYHNKIEEQKKAQMQRLRLIELQRKQTASFLESINAELKKDNITSFKMIVENIEANKQSLQNQQIENQLKGYYKRIFDKTVKAIEKLEENKPLEQVSRLESTKKTYLKALEIKLQENYKLELEVRDKAELQFAKILKDRQNVKREKKKQKKARLESNTLNTPNNLGEQFLDDVEQEAEDEIKQVDVVELIMEKPQISDAKISEQFLIEWLEAEELKDADYLRCLLTQFCKLSEAQIKSMCQLQ